MSAESGRILSLKSVKTRFNLFQESMLLIESAGKNANLISQQVNQSENGLVVITLGRFFSEESCIVHSKSK